MPNFGFLRASVATLLISAYRCCFSIVGVTLGFDRKVLDQNSRQWAANILKACNIQVQISGLEHLPEGAAVLVGNHQGMLDILALMSTLPVPPVFATKAELFKIPVFGYTMRTMGHIPIYRGDREKAIASINQGAKKLQKTGHQLAFFPEGSRTRDGKIQSFKKGAFVFALESQLPLVPFAINGSFQCCPPGQKNVYSGVIQLEILPPISLENYTLEQRDELTQSAREQIIAAVDAQQVYREKALS